MYRNKSGFTYMTRTRVTVDLITYVVGGIDSSWLSSVHDNIFDLQHSMGFPQSIFKMNLAIGLRPNGVYIFVLRENAMLLQKASAFRCEMGHWLW